jgi:hypothetical protein
VGVGDDSANGGRDRGGIQRSGSRVGRQDQSDNEAENPGCTVSHQWVDVLGVAVDGDRVVHERLGAGRRVVMDRGRGDGGANSRRW